MPRDGNGNYTLPAGNPVVSNTLIAATWANTTMPDLGTETTDSLSRSGKGPMLAPLKIVDSSIPTPGLAFQNEPTTGILRQGAGDVRHRVLGTDVIGLTQTAATTFVNQVVNGTFNLGGAGVAAGTWTVQGNLIVETTGKLGIHQSSPSEILTVGDGTAAQIVRMLLDAANNQPCGITFSHAGTLQWLAQMDGGDQDLYFYSNGATKRHRFFQNGHVGIHTGGAAQPASVTLEIGGTDGALLLSRLTTTQRDALTTTDGMVIYNTTLQKGQIRENGVWNNLT